MGENQNQEKKRETNKRKKIKRKRAIRVGVSTSRQNTKRRFSHNNSKTTKFHLKPMTIPWWITLVVRKLPIQVPIENQKTDSTTRQSQGVFVCPRRHLPFPPPPPMWSAVSRREHLTTSHQHLLWMEWYKTRLVRCALPTLKGSPPFLKRSNSEQYLHFCIFQKNKTKKTGLQVSASLSFFFLYPIFVVFLTVRQEPT